MRRPRGLSIVSDPVRLQSQGRVPCEERSNGAPHGGIDPGKRFVSPYGASEARSICLPSPSALGHLMAPLTELKLVVYRLENTSP